MAEVPTRRGQGCDAPTGLGPGGDRQDDGYGLCLPPLDLYLSSGFESLFIPFSKVFNLENHLVGDIVLGKICGNVAEELRRNLYSGSRRKALGELEGNEAILGELEGRGVYVVEVDILDRSGLGPRGLLNAQLSLKANCAEGDLVMAMGRVDAEVLAHRVAANDFK